MYRDIWLFIYFCNGLNVADLVKLKFSSIIDGEICFIREKTKRTALNVKIIRASLLPDMQIIIDKWGNKPLPDNYIFPLMKETDDPIQYKKNRKQITKNINKRVNRIGEKLGIGKITTYVARHSHATALKRGGSSLPFIAEQLGDTDTRTTADYLADFEKEQRMKNANFLTTYKKVGTDN